MKLKNEGDLARKKAHGDWEKFKKENIKNT